MVLFDIGPSTIRDDIEDDRKVNYKDKYSRMINPIYKYEWERVDLNGRLGTIIGWNEEDELHIIEVDGNNIAKTIQLEEEFLTKECVRQ